VEVKLRKVVGGKTSFQDKHFWIRSCPGKKCHPPRLRVCVCLLNVEVCTGVSGSNAEQCLPAGWLLSFALRLLVSLCMCYNRVVWCGSIVSTGLFLVLSFYTIRMCVQMSLCVWIGLSILNVPYTVPYIYIYIYLYAVTCAHSHVHPEGVRSFTHAASSPIWTSRSTSPCVAKRSSTRSTSSSPVWASPFWPYWHSTCRQIPARR
jgi:hypothetical protein